MAGEENASEEAQMAPVLVQRSVAGFCCTEAAATSELTLARRQKPSLLRKLGSKCEVRTQGLTPRPLLLSHQRRSIQCTMQ